MKPSIGRTVHYSYFGRRMAAVVTGIRLDLGDDAVDLELLGNLGPAPSKGPDPSKFANGVRYANDHQVMADPNAISIPHGMWTWPPRV